MTKDRMTCPTCGRPDLAATVVRGPRVNRGRPIPAIRVPVRHKRLLDDGTLGPICEPPKGNIGYLVRGAGLDGSDEIGPFPFPWTCPKCGAWIPNAWRLGMHDAICDGRREDEQPLPKHDPAQSRLL